jgi:hypothetical protein
VAYLTTKTPDYIQTLIGMPTSAERRALRAIVADADILEVENEWGKMRFLVAVIASFCRAVLLDKTTSRTVLAKAVTPVVQVLSNIWG